MPIHHRLNSLSSEFEDRNTVLLAVSKDEVSTIAGYQGGFDLKLLSDPSFETARRFLSYDDFENIELHSTLLINVEGQVHWSIHGGEPFMDFSFLLEEIDRIENQRAVNMQWKEEIEKSQLEGSSVTTE